MTVSVSSVGLAAPDSSGPMSLDMHGKSDAELDLLSFGVMALDRNGTIRRYNRVEARLARLDRALVLGKSFFRTIAPCTATPEFEGRFRDFADNPSGPSRVRFQYVFNFRFGAQEVDIEFLRSSSPDYIYIQVGRRSFQQQAVREVPGGKLDAIAIDQLAPTESKQGVIRDALERRHLVVDAGFLQTLFDSFAQEPRGSIEDLGASYGRRLAIDLETDAEESFGVGLRELPIVTLVELIAKLLGRQGWGVLTADLRPARSGVMTFTLGRSALAEAPGSLGGKRCSLTAGILRALLTHVAARPMTVCETRCAAEGGGECTFVATGSGREAQLTNAIASTGGYLSDVLVALARS